MNLRSGPGTQYSILKLLGFGLRFYAYENSSNWLRIGENQWVYGGYTKKSTAIKSVRTTAKEGLNVRSGPGTGYSIIKVLPYNTKVDVLEQKNSWYRIDNSGWINSYYTKLDGGLYNTAYEWWYTSNKNHEVPKVDSTVDISKYDDYYVGNTESKTIYLTIDLGYEAGYTSTILDTLKKYGVKVTFFVTKSYIDQYPNLIKRMVDEGHVVGNHTKTHPSLPSVTKSESTFKNEILSVAEAYKKVTGSNLLKIIRPPMGAYSELSLAMTQKLGYKSIFWSFAYYDYDQNKQPNKTEALKKITEGIHNGAIMLSYGVSKTNTEILSSVINNIKKQGYDFETLDKLN